MMNDASVIKMLAFENGSRHGTFIEYLFVLTIKVVYLRRFKYFVHI
jgi:hypothetical protein